MRVDHNDVNATTEASIRTKDVASVPLDSNPTAPAPAQDGGAGIAPIADFLPQDAPNLSHPTPLPDAPVVSGEADVDVEMANTEIASHPTPVSNEQTLVRPREDDAEDEPAAKRSRTEGDLVAETEASLAALSGAPIESDPVASEPAASGQPVVGSDSAVAPQSEPQSSAALAAPVLDDLHEGAPQAEPAPAVAPVLPDGVADLPVATTAQPPPTDNESAPAQDEPAQAQPPSQVNGGTTAPELPRYDTSPLTQLQRSFLVEKMKNLKKTKNSIAFLRPVDHIAMNIPTYPDIVKQPMDLGTMDAKLKEGKYTCVKDFTDDFELIISNVRRFNGDSHAVTQAGFSMQAYFNRMMEIVPSANANMPPPAAKKNRSPSLPKEEKPRREPRAVTQPAPPPAVAAPPTGTYAVAPNGTPQIRRQSSMSDRPARAIKPPQNREIAYAKPKRKERQLELKFCEHILEELRSVRYATLNHVFQTPVDPVALNIPNYFQVIKHPMDMSTMAQRLKAGEYGTADEFKKDFDLMIKNCLAFNPAGNPVRDLAIQFQREFEALWAGKTKWERKNQPPSNRASSASADEDSGADDDDDDEDDESADKSATIRALQKQLADLQDALSGLGEKPKSKKAKTSKATSRKSTGSVATAPPKAKSSQKPAAKSKKARQVTYEEKQEISDAVSRMTDSQVTGLTDLIVQNCAKYRNMDDMELEIDDLPPHVQVMLLDYVRRIFGNPNKKKQREPSPDDAAALDDDDYEEKGRAARSGDGGSKRKKHRPMGKQEQQDAISSLQNKLAQFKEAGGAGTSQSPTGSSFNAAKPEPDTSGDDASETSEEE